MSKALFILAVLLLAGGCTAEGWRRGFQGLHRDLRRQQQQNREDYWRWVDFMQRERDRQIYQQRNQRWGY